MAGLLVHTVRTMPYTPTDIILLHMHNTAKDEQCEHKEPSCRPPATPPFSTREEASLEPLARLQHRNLLPWSLPPCGSCWRLAAADGEYVSISLS